MGFKFIQINLQLLLRLFSFDKEWSPSVHSFSRNKYRHGITFYSTAQAWQNIKTWAVVYGRPHLKIFPLAFEELPSCSPIQCHDICFHSYIIKCAILYKKVKLEKNQELIHQPVLLAQVNSLASCLLSTHLNWLNLCLQIV